MNKHLHTSHIAGRRPVSSETYAAGLSIVHAMSSAFDEDLTDVRVYAVYKYLGTLN